MALAAGAGVELRVGQRFALTSRAELALTVRRPALHLDADEGPLEVFRAPTAGFSASFGRVGGFAVMTDGAGGAWR